MKGYYTGGQVTYGYKVENKKWLIDEEHAKFVRQVFEEYSQGEKATEIASHLNAQGSKQMVAKSGLEIRLPKCCTIKDI